MTDTTKMGAMMVEAGAELWANYGLEILESTALADGIPLDVTMAAIIGIVGKGIRGTLMLSMSPESLALSKPVQTADRDWISELGNQALGRFKNKLARCKVDVTATTPLVIRGHWLSPATENEGLRHRWLLNGGEALAWFALELAPTFVLGEPSMDDDGVIEGESLLF
jgi:hypothetical protein